MKKWLIYIFLIICTNNLIAQSETNHTTKKSFKGPFLTHKFKDNWSIGIAGGANLYQGEDDSKGNLMKRISPSLEISANKWLTPIWGFRLLGSVGQAHGWSAIRSNYSVKKSGDLYFEKFSLISGQFALLFNMTTSLKGYRENRIWSFIPYLGAGGARSALGVNINREFIINVGFLNNIRLTRNFDLTVDLRHILANSRLDETVRYKKLYEGMSTLSIGLSYKFGKHKKGNHSSDYWQDYSLYISESDSLIRNRKQIIEENDSLKNRMKLIEANLIVNNANNGISDTIVINDTIVLDHNNVITPPLVLFFKRNQAQLDSKGKTNLNLYVKYVINQTEDKVFRLIGSADIDTGNSKFNLRLSERRVDEIYNILVNKYHIPKKRLIKRPEGDTNNQFPSPLLNRAVIIR